MLNKLLLSLISTAIFSALLAGSASAAGIDFTQSDPWSDAHGQRSYATTVDGVGMTFTAHPRHGRLFHQAGDGFGIDSRYIFETPDEIDRGEMLSIRFDRPVYVESFEISQIYREKVFGRAYLESGWFSVDGAEATGFHAEPGGDGTLTVLVGRTLTGLNIGAARKWFQDHDFSVSGLTLSSLSPGRSPVPEPESFVLLAAGALLVGFALRPGRSGS